MPRPRATAVVCSLGSIILLLSSVALYASPQMPAGAGATATLTVSLAGSGKGSVSSTPAGINCPGSCSASFSAGTQVTLIETPAQGSTSAGLSEGDCNGNGDSCTVTLQSDKHL